jgi:hypothetical protein
MSLVTNDDFKGYEHVSNNNKEYLKKDMAVPDVTGNSIIYLKPNTNIGDSEREISDTKDRSGHSSEDLCLDIAQCLSDKNVFAQTVDSKTGTWTWHNHRDVSDKTFQHS